MKIIKTFPKTNYTILSYIFWVLKPVLVSTFRTNILHPSSDASAQNARKICKSWSFRERNEAYSGGTPSYLHGWQTKETSLIERLASQEMGRSQAERKAELVPLRVGDEVMRRVEESDAEGREVTVLIRYQFCVCSSNKSSRALLSQHRS
jgi:hypothetical protein